MANTFRLKRSAVASKVPTTGDLQLGELALNTYDGKLYTKKDNGTASIVEIGGGGGVSDGDKGDITVSGSGATWTLDPSGVTAGTYNNSATAITPLTIDAKGRVTATGAGVTVTPAFSSITSKPTTLSGYGITDAASSTHTHGNISNAGAIGTTSGLPIVTTTSGVLTTGSFGTTAGTFCQGNDSRLSDTRANPNAVTFNNGGAGAASGSTYTGAATLTVSYNTVGAPSTAGTGASGSWGISITGNAATATMASQVPQNARTSAYTLVASDTGRHISITTGGVTVPASVFNIGDIVTIVNNSTSNQTITQGASVTLRLAGGTNTGNRTLAAYGVATLLCIASNVFVISGAGLT